VAKTGQLFVTYKPPSNIVRKIRRDKYIQMKEFETLLEEIDYAHQPEYLQEGILRTGAALFYGQKAKQSGDKIVQKTQSARAYFTKAKREEGLEKKVELLAEGLENLSDAIIYNRMMLGNITGVAVSTAVFTEKNTSQMNKIMKGLKIR
jgi:hypothetical protein